MSSSIHLAQFINCEIFCEKYLIYFVFTTEDYLYIPPIVRFIPPFILGEIVVEFNIGSNTFSCK